MWTLLTVMKSTMVKKTKAELIWVTTCPVANGYPVAGDLDAGGKSPGRTAGVMKKYRNPWVGFSGSTWEKC